MFAIVPQSVTIIVPGEDAPMPTLVFRNDGDDVARSVLEVTNPKGHKHILTFNTRGQLVDQQFIEAGYPGAFPPNEDPEQIEPVPSEGEPHAKEGQVTKEPDHQAAPGSEKQPA